MGANCAASASIACLFCCQGCNAEKIRVAVTFLPPPPSYSCEVQESSTGQDDLPRGKMVYLSDQLRNFSFYQQAAEHAEVHFVRTARGERIPFVWMRPSGASSASSPAIRDPQRLVLLHCHGNATDIGMMMGPYFEMSKQLGIEVVGIEYSGYGVSTGTPNAANTLADVEAVYDHLVKAGISPDRIAAYGQSIGSGPVTHLAAKRRLGGLVLHSPLMSGIKVIDPQPDKCCRPSCVYVCCDFYPNDKYIRTVRCPAFVIHGELDDIVPCYHGHSLFNATPDQYRWPGYFPPAAGHNDIVETNAAEYFKEVRDFLSNVAQRGAGSLATSEKPMQVEMQATNNGMVLGAKEADRRGGEGDGGPAISTFGVLSYPEPKVGPEDGLYKQLRRQQDSPASGGARGARELQPVPLVGSSAMGGTGNRAAHL